MKKIAFLLLLLTTSIITTAQYFQQFDIKKFEFQFKTGLNISKIYNDTNILKQGFNPIIGIRAKTLSKNNISTSSSIYYSRKSSSHISPFYKIKNNYLDFEILFNYHISKELLINTGLTYSHLLNSFRAYLNENGNQNIRINNYKSEITIPLGIEYKLQNNIDIGFNYFLPTTKKSTKNIQLQVNYSLVKKTESHRSQRKLASRTQILQLKNGILFVRLKTSINPKSALEKNITFMI